MVTKDTLLKDLYKGTSLEEYAKYFYYGFEGDEWLENKIGYFCDGLWGNDETVESLNYFESEWNKGNAGITFFDKSKKDVNFFYLKHDKVSPLAILCAGGGYGSVATAVEVSKIAEHLHKLGFAVLMLTYSINEDALNDESLNDLVNAIKYIEEHKNEYNVDTNNYIVGGCSAGGHLASRLGTNNSGYLIQNIKKPGLIFLAYPVIDFGENAHIPSRNRVLGMNATKEQIDFVSTHKHVDDTYPPVFMWQCDKDSIIGINHSILMEKALKAANVPYKYEMYSSDAHGWGFAKGRLAEGWVDRMLAFYYEVTK